MSSQLTVLSLITKAPMESHELIDAFESLAIEDFGEPLQEYFNWLRTKFNAGQSIYQDDLVLYHDSDKYMGLITSQSGTFSYKNLPVFIKQMKNERYTVELRQYFAKCIGSLNQQGVTVEEKVNQVLEIPFPREWEHTKSNLKTFPSEWNKILESWDSPPELGEKTGLPNLDKIIMGNNSFGVPSNGMIAVIGGTKQGKSTVALTMFLERAQENQSSLVFSMEVSANEITRNLLAQKAQVPRGDIVRKKPHVLDKLIKAGAEIAKKNIQIYDTPSMSLEFILLTARIEAKKRPIKTIMIDYLTLIKRPSSNARSDEVWGEMVKSLGQLAKEIDCVVIIVSQINRNVESRNNKRPTINDTRDTSQLQFQCHLMLGVYMHSRILEGHDRQIEVSILAQRNGTVGETVYFDAVGGNISPKSKEEAELYNKLIEL